jgi:hypothetical protein
MSTRTLRNIVAATVIGGCGLFASENFWTTTSSSSFLTQAEARYGVGRYGVARYGVARRGYRRAAIAGAVVGGALAAGYGYGYGYGTGYPYYSYTTTSPTYGSEYYGITAFRPGRITDPIRATATGMATRTTATGTAIPTATLD